MMATLKDYFDREARHYLARLGALVADPAAAFGSGELHRVARGLRGTAQMARQDAVYRIALALEIVARPGLSRAAPPPGLAERLEETLADLRQLVERATDPTAAGRIADGAVSRWGEIDAKAGAAAAGAAAPLGTVHATEAAAERAFLAFAAREVGALADELERSVAALISNPLDREAIKRVLRQQRALLGSARLDEVPIVAEALRAVEDLARVVAKLDVPVKGEWLDVFRSARDILHVAAPALAAREQPAPTNALSRLRTLREELLERYGTGEAVSIAPGEGLQQPTTVLEPPPPVGFPQEAAAAQPMAARAPTAGAERRPETAPEVVAAEPAPPEPLVKGEAVPDDVDPTEARPDGAARRDGAAAGEAVGPDDVVDIELLCYRGSAALRRALALRARLEAAVGNDDDARDAMDELFDLIRLGLQE